MPWSDVQLNFCGFLGDIEQKRGRTERMESVLSEPPKQVYVPPRQRDVHQDLAVVLNQPRANEGTLAAELNVDVSRVRGFWRTIRDVDDRAAVVVDRARDYFEHRRYGGNPPHDVSPQLYDALANWYAVNVRPHAQN